MPTGDITLQYLPATANTFITGHRLFVDEKNDSDDWGVFWLDFR